MYNRDHTFTTCKNVQEAKNWGLWNQEPSEFHLRQKDDPKSVFESKGPFILLVNWYIQNRG